MSDAPLHEAADSDTPTMDELDRVAFDAVVRNAPRFGRFIGTGAAIGGVAGFAIGLVLPNSTSLGRGVVALLVAAGFAIIGAIVASALVVGVDRTPRAPAQSGFPWERPDVTDAQGRQSVGPDDAKGDTA